jgi:RNA polymerase sigma-70 factor (ECF subfamily)
MTDSDTPASDPERGPASAEPADQLARLFHQHADGLTGAIRAVLGPRAELADVLQEAFARVLAGARRGAAPADPVAWIFVVTMNLAKDLRRRRARRRDPETIEDEAMDGITSDGRTRAGALADGSPHERLERSEALAAARSAIARLPDGEKEIFLMRTSAGLTFESAARALGIPVGTAKTRMRAALAHLRWALARFAPEGRPGHAPAGDTPETGRNLS